MLVVQFIEGIADVSSNGFVLFAFVHEVFLTEVNQHLCDELHWCDKAKVQFL
jgi:hypothetical protein